MNLSQETSASSDADATNSRFYENLITRLGRSLKHHPNFDEEEEEDDDEPWCHCKQGSLGSEGIRCDVPNCRVRWYHKACLPYKDLQLAEDFDLWICPNCLVHQLLDLIREQNPTGAFPQLEAGMDEAMTQQINMALIDVRLQERGQWIFKNPVKSAARRRQREMEQSARLRPDTPISIASTGNLHPESVTSRASSRSDTPKPGTLGANASFTEKLSMSVDNARSLQETARIWTSQSTQVVEMYESTLMVEYKHGCKIPKLHNEINNSRRILLKCNHANGQTNTIEVSLDLLLNFCLNLHFVFRQLLDQPSSQGLLGTVRLKHIGIKVLKRALKFLQGGPLAIPLPDNDTPLTKKQKSTLVQYTHLAHMLSIQPLQNAAMHALCTSILRRPQDWSDQVELGALLQKMTFKTNPARRVLIDGPDCLLSDKNSQDLPCGVEQRDIICMNRGIKALWRTGGRMSFEYARNLHVMEENRVSSTHRANEQVSHSQEDIDMEMEVDDDNGGCFVGKHLDHDNTAVSDDENDDNFQETDSDDNAQDGSVSEDEYIDL
ncbi:hypothetical protein LTR84_003623 [Exophiala bonariae]|uniref:Zinc finger PHD-type domain-containing protein n=1 Tax=Exophiala bonariae TaxID=1690606 RepID=A0AAV9N6U3_9EURO|nr:hypothetical protein LTR84_003623 [Exophiala bonariae]